MWDLCVRVLCCKLHPHHNKKKKKSGGLPGSYQDHHREMVLLSLHFSVSLILNHHVLLAQDNIQPQQDYAHH